MEECSLGEAGMREKETRKEGEQALLVVSSVYSVLSVGRPCELLCLGEEGKV